MNQALKIHHELADVVLTPTTKVNVARLKKMIRTTLDQYQEQERLPASIIHAETKLRNGDDYGTPGFYLRLFRNRAELTQVELAKKAKMHQHHLSEMENNKRSIGKASAQKLAAILNCDYHQLL